MKSKKNKAIPELTEGQKRSLAVGLQLVEEKLLTLQLWARNGDYSGEIYSLKIDLDEEERRQLNDVHTEIRAHIHSLKEKLALPSKTAHLSDLLRGSEAYLWSMLCDETADKLKRYGPVAKNLKMVLDPEIEQILTHLNTLSKLIAVSGNSHSKV